MESYDYTVYNLYTGMIASSFLCVFIFSWIPGYIAYKKGKKFRTQYLYFILPLIVPTAIVLITANYHYIYRSDFDFMSFAANYAVQGPGFEHFVYCTNIYNRRFLFYSLFCQRAEFESFELFVAVSVSLYPILLWIVALIHVLRLNPDQDELDARQLASGTLKRCPGCAEVIQRQANVCRFCGRVV